MAINLATSDLACKSPVSAMLTSAASASVLRKSLFIAGSATVFTIIVDVIHVIHPFWFAHVPSGRSSEKET